MTLYKYSIAAEVVAVMLALNLHFFQSPIVGLFFTIVYFTILAKYWSFNWSTGSKLARFILGGLGLLASILLPGSIVYYFYQINNGVVDAFLFLLPLIGYAFTKLTTPKTAPNALNTPLKNPAATTIIVLAFFAASLQCLNLLYQASTTSSLRSTFQTLNDHFFIYYGLAIILLFLIARLNRPTLKTAASSLFLFISFAAGIIIYKVGFGFDPFIHQATERYIFEHGFILPKPLYYLGQYFLLVFTSKISFINVALLDKWLVPITASLVFPAATEMINFGWLSKFSTKTAASLVPLLLLLPFSTFTISTPQSLANVLLLAMILLSMNEDEPKHILVLLALAILAIHPIAGLPALLLLVILFLQKQWPKTQLKLQNWHKILLPILIIAASFAMPLLFIVSSAFNQETPIKINGLWQSPGTSQTFAWLWPNTERKFSWFYDIAYFWSNNAYLFVFALAALGLLLVIKSGKWQRFSPYFWVFVILIANYFFLSRLINFSFLIEYEQNNYPRRILEIAFYFFMPFVFVLFAKLADSSSETTRYKQTIFYILLTGIITNSFYFSYPHENKFETGHNISTSASDIDAVTWIENQAAGDYFVLSNQSVSAAALKVLGFKKYFNTTTGQVFFYPIPTGGQLYKYYLDMVYVHPGRETMKKAAELTGTHEGYFIINKYWTGFDRLVETAKSEADAWQSINNDEYVFQYKL